MSGKAQHVATAYHEAGHAVMGCVLGRYPQSVDIFRDAHGNAGHTRFDSDYPACMERWFDESEEKRRYLRVRVLIDFAGTVAHDLKAGDRLQDSGDQQDYQCAKRIVEESMSWDNDYDGYLARLKIETREYLVTHWASVEAVATALLRNSTLLRAEIIDLFKKSST
jgi:ATP-dependent Zn protease